MNTIRCITATLISSVLLGGLAYANVVVNPRPGQTSPAIMQTTVTGDTAAQLYQFLLQNNPNSEQPCGSDKVISVGTSSCINYADSGTYECAFFVDNNGNVTMAPYQCAQPVGGIGNGPQ